MENVVKIFRTQLITPTNEQEQYFSYYGNLGSDSYMNNLNSMPKN